MKQPMQIATNKTATMTMMITATGLFGGGGSAPNQTVNENSVSTS